MSNYEINYLFGKCCQSNGVTAVTAAVLLISLVFGIYLNLFLGIITICAFGSGAGLCVLILNNFNRVSRVWAWIRRFVGENDYMDSNKNDCDVCGELHCGRHQASPTREPWKGLFLDKELDNAVDSFYTRIITSFVASWFTLLTKDEDFVHALKQNLREATCRLIIKLKGVNVFDLLTNKLLPCAFDHYELVQKLLNDGITIDRLAKTMVLNERAIHPAVLNRQSELDYLRDIAKCLIPRLCNDENFNSKTFCSLVRELLACWVLLPLMDVVSDPNLINLLVVVATTKSGKYTKSPKSMKIVLFLEKFTKKSAAQINVSDEDDKFLSDQTQLYSFMQFLKKQGSVDVLRFYLDVDNLNKELLDPKINTDPAKLSTLYQQSEKLLKTYQTMQKKEYRDVIAETLFAAHQDVRASLQGKWKKAFHTTPEYFRLVYGGREIRETNMDGKNASAFTGEQQSVFRLGSKLKGAIRGAIDGAPLDATDTVWDSLSDDPSVLVTDSNTIYNSVTQKLRKERGQQLDSFISCFMQSIEPTTDIGEEPHLSDDDEPIKRPTQPGRNLVFGDLFELRKSGKYSTKLSYMPTIRNAGGSASYCMVYILVRILKTPKIAVNFLLAFINISTKTVDRIICKIINKLISIALYQPRLTMLITTLENHLFGPKDPLPSIAELLERQRLAKEHMETAWTGLGSVADVLQSPPLNKHLMYCLLDLILIELYPEFEKNSKG